MKKTTVILGAVVLTGALAWMAGNGVWAQNVPSARAIGTNYEYAHLIVGPNSPVFVEATRRSAVSSPTGLLPSSRSQTPLGSNLIRIATTEARDVNTEALNYFGLQGWESYAVQKDGNQTTYYMRRAIFNP